MDCYEAAIVKEAQIQRLERLDYDAIYALQKAGLDDAQSTPTSTQKT